MCIKLAGISRSAANPDAYNTTSIPFRAIRSSSFSDGPLGFCPEVILTKD